MLRLRFSAAIVVLPCTLTVLLAVALTGASGASASAPTAASALAASSSTPPDSVSVARAYLTGLGRAATVSSLRAAEVQAVGPLDVVRFQQVSAGVPVLGGESVVAVRRASGSSPEPVALSSTSETLSAAVASPNARVTASRARQAALATARGVVGAHASTPVRWIFDPRIIGAPGPQTPRLVWRTTLTSPKDLAFRRMVLIDATTAKVALAIDETEGLERWVCDNADDPAADGRCVEPVRREGLASVGRADIDSAFDFAGDTARFLTRVLGRAGIDGRSDAAFGGVIRSTVRYCPPQTEGGECPYANAFWSGDQMLYGAGYASAQDVVAHELMHGVTQYGPRLFYYHQSGAINESLSDSLGELADLWARGSGGSVIDTDAWSVRWQMGEDLPGGAIRSLSRPTVDRMGSPRFARGEDDMGGVHENSGVGNKFTVLLTDGGTFNGRVVTGVGVAKAAAIIYSASQLLTSGSDYRAYGRALDTACRALIGGRLTDASRVITASDCVQVRAAAAAVQMGVSVGAPAVSLCPRGTTAAPLVREGFERGRSAWSASGLADWYHSTAANPYGFDARYAASGTGSLWGNDGTRAGSSTVAMRRDVRLPAKSAASRTTYAVRFNHAYGFWPSTDGPTADGAVVEYSTDSGRTWRRVTPARWKRAGGANGYTGTVATNRTNPLTGSAAFVGHSGGYMTSRFDVTDLAGHTLRLRFRIGQVAKPAGDTGDLGWFLDDVTVVACL